MIQLNELRFRYPKSDFQLAMPQLEVAPGEKIAVVGPSGCGKTTLLNLIAGISLPDSGTVEVEEQTISQMSDAERRNFRIAKIGMVFQQFELVEYLDLKRNILLPFLINASLKLTKQVEQHAEDLAREMGLADKLKRRPSQLSQGEKQRCAICRALVTEPKILLADEPTGNLDPRNKKTILALMDGQVAKHNQTLIVVTHDLSILDGMDRTIDFEQFRSEVAVAGGQS